MKTANKVSLNRVIGNVIGNLGLKVTNNIKDDFARWACEAENKIGSTSSYKHFECELTVKNRKTSLPPNFSYLEAMQIGNKIINMTERSFRMFNKGTKGQVAKETDYVGGQKVTNIPGVPLVIQVDLSGAFAAGDLINITITSNDCGDISSNTFNYIVQTGETLTMIAANIAAQINAIGNIGYSSTGGNDQFFITGCSPEISFNVVTWTDSATGTLSQCIYQKRVPTKTKTINNNDLHENPTLTSKNLTHSDVAELNSGILNDGNINGNSVFGTGIYGYDYGGNTASIFSITNGCINFNTIDNAKIGISYMGIDLCPEGWPMISETHEDAVTSYIMFMYKSIEYYNGKIPKHVHETLERRWYD